MSRNNGVNAMYVQFKLDDFLLSAEKFCPSPLARLLQRRREAKRKEELKVKLKPVLERKLKLA